MSAIRTTNASSPRDDRHAVDAVVDAARDLAVGRLGQADDVGVQRVERLAHLLGEVARPEEHDALRGHAATLWTRHSSRHERDPRPGASDLAELLRRRALTEDAARPEAVARRHERGGRTARENVADLVDEGSWVEYGRFAIAAQRQRRDRSRT